MVKGQPYFMGDVIVRPLSTVEYTSVARNRRRIGVGIPTPASDLNKLQIINIESYP